MPAASAAAAAPATPSPASAGRKKSPAGAKVYFVYPNNRGYVTPKPVIRFGLIGMGVAPAGFEKVNTGHHHLLIDTEVPNLDQPIPSDFNHLHFGAGQTEAKITLPLGKHTLQLLLGRREPRPARSAVAVGADHGHRHRQRPSAREEEVSQISSLLLRGGSSGA